MTRTTNQPPRDIETVYGPGEVQGILIGRDGEATGYLVQFYAAQLSAAQVQALGMTGPFMFKPVYASEIIVPATEAPCTAS